MDLILIFLKLPIAMTSETLANVAAVSNAAKWPAPRFASHRLRNVERAPKLGTKVGDGKAVTALRSRMMYSNFWDILYIVC